jgi:hypothetical protein
VVGIHVIEKGTNKQDLQFSYCGKIMAELKRRHEETRVYGGF